MAYWTATVRHTERVTPLMVRVTLRGEGTYEAAGLPDDYCRVLFPHPGEREPVLPVEVDGREETPPGLVEAPVRNYSLRRHRTTPGGDEVEIDVVVHPGGVGSGWAVGAAPGDRIALGPAHGRYKPAADVRRVVLVGDATALPAIGRILEELPADRAATAVVLVESDAERQDLRCAAPLDLTWLAVRDPGPRLVSVVRGLDLPEGAYVWVAGETAACREVRRHLRHERGLPVGSWCVVGYWRPDAERWQARYTALAPELEEKMARADSEHPDDDDYDEAVDRIFTDAGL